MILFPTTKRRKISRTHSLQSSYPSSPSSFKTEGSSSPPVASSRATPYPPRVTSPRRTRSGTSSTDLPQKTQGDTPVFQTPPLPSGSKPVPPRPDDEDGILMTEYLESQQLPFRSFRIKPSTIPLKDACRTATPQRSIVWRRNCPWILRNEWNRSATIVQAIGEEQPTPCNCCILGRGPFEQCVNFTGTDEQPEIAKGACANCLWSSHARRCSFRPDCSWEVGASRSAVPRPPARKGTANNTPTKTARSLPSPSVVANTFSTRISRHNEPNNKKEQEDEGLITSVPIAQARAFPSRNGVADTSATTIDQSKHDQSPPNGEVIASDASVPASNPAPPFCNGTVAEGKNHDPLTNNAVVGTPEVLVDPAICGPRPCNGSGNGSRASIELLNYNTPHLNGIINRSSMTTPQSTKDSGWSVDLPLGQDSQANSNENGNKHDKEGGGGLGQKTLFQTPGAFKGHEFIVFPGTLNPNDESAIEKALGEARAICGRLELRLDKLRAVSWDSDPV